MIEKSSLLFIVSIFNYIVSLFLSMFFNWVYYCYISFFICVSFQIMLFVCTIYKNLKGEIK